MFKNTKMVVAAKLLVSCGLLVFIISKLDFKAGIENFNKISSGTMISVFILLNLQMLLAGLRWQKIIERIAVRQKWARLVSFVYIGQFFNQILPTSIGGDGVRAWYVHKNNMSLEKSVCSVLIDRYLGVGCLCILLLIVLLINDSIGFPPAFLISSYTIAAVLTISVIMFPIFFLSFKKLAEYKLGSYFVRLSIFIKRVIVSRHCLPVLVLSLLIHLITALVFYSVLLELCGCADFSAVALITLIVVLSGVIPVSIAGWGVRETIAVSLFPVIGVSTEQALVVSVFYGIALLLTALPGILFWLLTRNESIVSIKNEIKMDV